MTRRTSQGACGRPQRTPQDSEHSTTVGRVLHVGTRKLRRANATAGTIVEQFFGTLQADPLMSCYGPSASREALAFFAVDELLIAEGMDVSMWTELATNHKVIRVHVISPDCPLGRRFCKGVRVGGLLSRPLEPSPEEEWSLPPQLLPGWEAPGPAPQPPQAPVRPQRSTSEALYNFCDAALRPFFRWLKHALASELSLHSAQALWDGACVILASDSLSDDSDLEERLDNAEMILAAEAPRCAAALRARWYNAVVEVESPPRLSDAPHVPSDHPEIPAESVNPEPSIDPCGAPSSHSLSEEVPEAAAGCLAAPSAAAVAAVGDCTPAPEQEAPFADFETGAEPSSSCGSASPCPSPVEAAEDAFESSGATAFFTACCSRLFAKLVAASSRLCRTRVRRRPPPEPPPRKNSFQLRMVEEAAPRWQAEHNGAGAHV